jgi:hypothetical protein
METTKTRNSLSAMGLTSLVLIIALTGCSDSSNNKPSSDVQKPQADNPVVEGPVTAGGADDCCKVTIFGVSIDIRDLGYEPGTAFYGRALAYDESEVGYRETEYFISGTAQSYIATDALGSDGLWAIAAAEAAPYKSRIVVDRPIDPADFNGTVVVEWLNVTGGLDASPDWNQIHTEVTREGYIWVGVSAQFVGIEGGNDREISIPLKKLDPERYGSLSHPGDSFSYDIFSQAAQAVRNPVGLDPLEGLQVERMIGMGQSQSAGRLATYINAVHPTVDLFDGFIVHGRGSSSSALSQEPQVEVATPELVYMRTDIPEPIIALQAEGDVLWAIAGGDRQQDSPGYRLWEVAGAAHTDLYTASDKGSLDQGDDPAVADVIAISDVVPPLLICGKDVNDGSAHWVTRAALAAMNDWISAGVAAPSAPLLELNADSTGFELDSLGNVKGGIRTPFVDAPVAILSGLGQEPGGLCGLFGTTILFGEVQLADLYPDKQSYIDAIDASADSAVDAGFLVPADGELIKARARTSPLPAAHPTAGE